MRKTLLPGFALSLILVASVAGARGREPFVRSLYLRGDPKDEVPQLYVVGQVATVLRFQQPCDPEGTKMLGWEGRFEPVACTGKSVLLIPLQNLEPTDRLMLLVTLADGQEVPFTVTAPVREAWGRPDQQVNVFLDPEAPDALRTQLAETQARERKLWEMAARHARENTEDHALAKLLTKGSAKLTSFRPRKSWYFKKDGAIIQATVFTSKNKVAVWLSVTNRHPSAPWSLAEARLKTTRAGETPPLVFGESKKFALQTSLDEIPPGQSGTLAIVFDKSAFTSREGPCDLTVEIYRHDGLLEAHVLVERRLVRQ
jgi:uncharacterized protein (TIGR02268 family)